MDIKIVIFSSSLAAYFALTACKPVDHAAIDQTVTAPVRMAPTAEDTALYEARWQHRITGQTLDRPYDTLIPIAGDDSYRPLSRSAPTISQQALAQAEDYAAARNSSAFMIWRDGAVEFERYFGDNNKDSLIVSKSLAKPVSVIAVGRAIHLGYIGALDQPVANFITEWNGTPKDKILVRHLLDMHSGLLPQADSRDPNNVLNLAYLHPRHEDVIVNDYPLVTKPGTRYDYSNATSDLVAVLIERATGIGYEDWVSKHVLTPLGAKGGEIWMNRDGGMPHAGCCVLLPAETYLRLAVLYMQDGIWGGERVLPIGYVEQVITPTTQKPHSGMGVYLAGDYVERRGPLNPDTPFGETYHGEPYLADDLFLFDGNSNQTVYIIPSANTIILRTGEWASKDMVWDNSVLPNTIIRGIDFPEGTAPTPQNKAD